MHLEFLILTEINIRMLHLRAKVLILILMSGSITFAQDESSKSSNKTPGSEKQVPFRLGIHASPNFSYIATDDASADGSVKMKFGFGLITEFNFAKNYSFSTGVEYVLRGGETTVDVKPADWTPPSSNGRVKSDYTSGFIQIPLMLKLRTRPFGYYTYFVDLGGSVNIRASEKHSFTPAPADENKSYVEWIGGLFSIGLGGEYDLGGQTSLLLGLYYNHSLFDNLKAGAPGDNLHSYHFDYVNLKIGVLF